MVEYSQISSLHLELTTNCNAKCPACPRNLNSFDFNQGYPECDMTLANVKKILPAEFLKQITNIYISGDFGDYVMNPDSIEILEYLRTHSSPKVFITIGTNGGARDKLFWQKTAKLAHQVIFCIDGLEDTHSVYRRNTVYKTVMQNAKTVIAAGGKALWKFILFDHNRHQVEQAKTLSQQIGFDMFILADHGRNSAPVFDKRGQLIYWIGPDYGPSDAPGVLKHTPRKLLPSTALIVEEPADQVNCQSHKNKEIYIAANGEVYPCCYMGHYPHTYQKNMATNLGLCNWQVSQIAKENNALQYGLEHAINWFASITELWKKPDWESGRLLVCDQSCGEKTKLHNNTYTRNI